MHACTAHVTRAHIVSLEQREYFVGHTDAIMFVGFASLPASVTIPTVGPLDTTFQVLFRASCAMSHVWYVRGAADDGVVCVPLLQSSPMVVVITVDVTGKIMYWPYRKDNFSAYVWFTPGVRLKLNMQIPTFTENAEASPTVMFPPEGVKMPENPDQNAKYQRIVRARLCR